MSRPNSHFYLLVALGLKGGAVGLKGQCSQLLVSGALSFHSTEEFGGFCAVSGRLGSEI